MPQQYWTWNSLIKTSTKSFMKYSSFAMRYIYLFYPPQHMTKLAFQTFSSGFLHKILDIKHAFKFTFIHFHPWSSLFSWLQIRACSLQISPVSCDGAVKKSHRKLCVRVMHCLMENSVSRAPASHNSSLVLRHSSCRSGYQTKLFTSACYWMQRTIVHFLKEACLITMVVFHHRIKIQKGNCALFMYLFFPAIFYSDFSSP